MIVLTKEGVTEKFCVYGTGISPLCLFRYTTRVIYERKRGGGVESVHSLRDSFSLLKDDLESDTVIFDDQREFTIIILIEITVEDSPDVYYCSFNMSNPFPTNFQKGV